MKITVNLDTQAVIIQPTLTRVKAASYVAVEISFTRSSQTVRLLPAPPDLAPYALKSELPVIGTAAKLDAGTPTPQPH